MPEKIPENINGQLCPCESGKLYKHCCQPLIERTGDAATAEQLMRSRYSAFVSAKEDYLRYSWHPDTCPKTIHLDTDSKWLGLKIKYTTGGGESDNSGTVEFVARYKIMGKAHRIHETSRFTRIDGRWVYLDGKNKEKK